MCGVGVHDLVPVLGFHELLAVHRERGEELQHGDGLGDHLDVGHLVLFPPDDREELHFVFIVGRPHDHAVVEDEVVLVLQVELVPQDVRFVHVEAGPEVVDHVPADRGEQEVVHPVAERAERGVTLELRALHEAGAEEAVVLLVLAVLEVGQDVRNVALVVPVEHDDVVEPVVHRVPERHFVGPAEAVVVVVAQDLRLDGQVPLFEVVRRDLLAAVRRPVVDDDDFAQVRTDLVSQLPEHAGDLLLAVVHGDEQKDLTHCSKSPFWHFVWRCTTPPLGALRTGAR